MSTARSSHQDVGIHNDSANFFHITGDISMTLLCFARDTVPTIDWVNVFGLSRTAELHPSPDTIE